MKRSIAVISASVLLVMANVLPVPAWAGASGTPTVRASVSSNGTQSNGLSYFALLSADGRHVAFASEATNLVPGGIDGVYVHDTRTRRTELVSVASDGTPGNGLSWFPAVSGEGRFAAFMSRATNLVPDDTNGTDDIFVRDRRTGQTERVSLDVDGTQMTNYSWRPSISADGRFVVFVNGTNTGEGRILLRDRREHRTVLISRGAAGEPANNYSETPEISADGRYVAFSSGASNLVPGDTNGAVDIFRYDCRTGRTIRVSVGDGGEQNDMYSFLPAISGNGRYVTFTTQSTNLVPGHTGYTSDIFVRDVLLGRTTVVSLGTDGSPGNGDSDASAMSFSGRYIVYETFASNIVPGGDDGRRNVLLYDQVTHRTRLVPRGYDGTVPNAGSGSPSIDASGRTVAYVADASNLVPDDTNDNADVFVAGTSW